MSLVAGFYDFHPKRMSFCAMVRNTPDKPAQLTIAMLNTNRKLTPKKKFTASGFMLLPSKYCDDFSVCPE